MIMHEFIMLEKTILVKNNIEKMGKNNLSYRDRENNSFELAVIEVQLGQTSLCVS